jgi:hypothetical protein
MVIRMHSAGLQESRRRVVTQPNQNHIDAKDAVKRAVAYVTEIYTDTGAAVGDFLLEEIEMNESETVWRVTVSFRMTNLPSATPGTLASVILGPYAPKVRAYKLVEVDATTGHIRSMKIREVPTGNA